jgi:hypothetical protein
MNSLDLYYHSMIWEIAQNVPLFMLWTISFVVLLGIIVAWLSYRITQSSSKRAVDMATENRRELDRLMQKIDGLDHYLRDTFQRDLGGAMESFDRTVSSVLGEMKDELMHGVTRIEKIETAVKGREKLGDKIFKDTGEVKHLLDAVREEPKKDAAAELQTDDAGAGADSKKQKEA